MTRLLRSLLAFLLLLPLAATAQGLLGGLGSSDDFLPPDEAFQFSAEVVPGDRVAVRWVIADGYYLYRHRLAARTETPGISVGALEVPTGEKKTDEFFGEVEVYHQQLDVSVPFTRAQPDLASFEIKVTFQGCAEKGLCDPPTTKTVALTLPPPGAAPVAAPPASATGTGTGMMSEQDRLARLISTGNLFVVMAPFFGLGLLLAFTPCVLPMVPILSGIIAGQGAAATPRRSFLLSLCYVLGMALTYTVAGAAFAAAGQQAQTFFQQPWIIVGFALLFVALALSMFGLYELQLPSALQTRLNSMAGRQKAGTLAGTFVMGALSALVVTACVAPPLVAALAVIGQSGDVLRGALALFALSFGMGAPLLVVGVAGGRLLPKAGPWMNTVKSLFGVMFLGVAVWMLERILPGPLTLALWALLAFVAGYYFGGFGTGSVEGSIGRRVVAKALGIFVMAYGLVLLVGAAAGSSSPLQPLRGVQLFGESPPGVAAPEAPALAFRDIRDLASLDRELAVALAAGKPVMLDLYADWCVSCKEMEKYTFSDPGVQADLAGFVLLKADVTANDAGHQALLKHLGTFGPPTTAFYGKGGGECRDFRLVGFVPAADFRSHLARFTSECRS